MKIYEENKAVQKSWCLKLKKNEDRKVFLSAVDAVSGIFITHILYFYESGKITICPNMKQNLDNLDYNPHEHGNRFDTKGRIIIQDEV